MPGLLDIQRICGSLDRGDIDSSQFLEQFNRAVAAQIGCTRAGTWVLIDEGDGRAMRCVAMFDALRDRIASAPDVMNAESPEFFDSLRRDGCVVATDAQHHPATASLTVDYLQPQNIHSLLGVGYSVNGVLFGMFTCEQVGCPQAWTQRQLMALRQLGAMASLTLMHAVSVNLDTAPGALWEPSPPHKLATAPVAFDDEPVRVLPRKPA